MEAVPRTRIVPGPRLYNWLANHSKANKAQIYAYFENRLDDPQLRKEVGKLVGHWTKHGAIPTPEERYAGSRQAMLDGIKKRFPNIVLRIKRN